MQIVLVLSKELLGQHFLSYRALIRVENTVSIEIKAFGQPVVLLTHVAIVVLEARKDS